ncbi:ATP-grasp domain-containing protein [Paraburkholderia sp. EG286B]|uniref:D-alanine--D-alanine ligase family protein n=1 Tax=Paraburkholderia sp. EG286B TaxID=3237011 RepID=UPI0034D32CC3
MSKRDIVVVTGGIGPEREGALVSGDTVASAVAELGHNVSVVDFQSIDDLITLPKDAIVFPTTHGWFGEDGRLQSVLDLQSIHYLGSGVTASAICMYKPACLQIADALHIRCPPWTHLSLQARADEEAARIVTQLGNQLFVKPSSGGSSLGATSIDGRDALEAHIRGLRSTDDYIVCRRIVGTDVSVGLLTVETQLICLPMLATFHEAEFYDYEVKCNSALHRHECPAPIPNAAKSYMESAARRAFEAIPCSGFARADFLVDQSGDPWFLEINTLPGMSRQGIFATMASASGLSYTDLVSSMINSHIPRNGYRP